MSIQYTYVYLIFDPFTGLYKIGRSDTPEKRRDDLCKQSTILAAPADYEIIQAWICPPEIESEFHQEFAHLRERGEWFNLGEKEVKRIHTALCWYRRLYGNTPQAAEDRDYYNKLYRRTYDAMASISRLLVAAKEEVASLKRQRNYLVNQRRELTTFTEPVQDEIFTTEAIQ